MKVIKNILYYITVSFLVVYILLLVVSPEKMMDVFGFRAFIVMSNSMEPVINVNDLIISKRVQEEDLKEGDIITFTVYLPDINDTANVTHYIGEIDDSGLENIYYTQGTHMGEGIYDGWEDEDGNPYYITFDDIEGEYAFKIPFLGYVQDLISDQKFVGLIIVNGVVLYILYKFIKKDEEEDFDEYEDEE